MSTPVQEKKISLSRLSKENAHSNQCILCHDGGGNLYSCKRNFCGKVYHIECYDPTNNREPPDYWTCLMCFTKQEFGKMSNEVDKYGNMGERDFKLCFRLMLEMKGNWPISRTFEPSETLDSQHYRDLIHYPVAMDVIQQRLNRSKGDNKYSNCTQFMEEVRRMFSNCRTFWSVNTSNSYSSGMYMRHADKLEAFFDEKIQEYEKFFSTYTEYLPVKAKKKVDSNVPKPEPYVPSFMHLASPVKEDKSNEKPKKCFVCQKLGSDANPTHKCSQCKRSYHSECYVPALKKEPPRDWNCIMCVTVDDLLEQPNEPNKEGGKLGKRDYLVCSRLFLELHKIWPDCKDFMRMSDLDFSVYRSAINHPIALDIIRKRMDRKYPLQYESIKEFLKDVKLMFKNCKTFWKDQPAGENFVSHAENLKAHLDKCLGLLEPLIPEKTDSKGKKTKEEKSSRSKRDDELDDEEKYLKARELVAKEEESGDEKPVKLKRSVAKDLEGIDEDNIKPRRLRAKREVSVDENNNKPTFVYSDDEKPLKPKRFVAKVEDSESDQEIAMKAKRLLSKSSKLPDSEDEEDSPRKRRPGPLSFKRNLNRKHFSKKEESDVDEEIPLRKMKLSSSKSKEEPDEPVTRRPGPASFKAKFATIEQKGREKHKDTNNNTQISSRKESVKQKDSEILRDTIAEEALEAGSSFGKEAFEKHFGKEYKCNHCQAVYNKLSKMQDHTLSHFEDELSSLLPSKKPHLCPTCDAKSPDNDALMKHYAFDCCESVNKIQESIRKNLIKS